MQIIILWLMWWTQRNKVREGEKPLDADAFAYRVACTAAEYRRCFGKMQKVQTNKLIHFFDIFALLIPIKKRPIMQPDSEKLITSGALQYYAMAPCDAPEARSHRSR